MEENVWSQPEIFSLLNKEYVIISYVDDRELLPDVDQFNYKYPNGRVKSIKTIGEKWATFQSLNFGSASQPFTYCYRPMELFSIVQFNILMQKFIRIG